MERSALRIVVAEDETLIRMDIEATLTAGGHIVVGSARDGLDLVALARRHQPDVVVADVRMPGLDGLAAATRITAERPVPFVILTASTDAEVVRRSVSAGAFAHLSKPFRPADLLAAVAHAHARFTTQATLSTEATMLADALDRERIVERAAALVALDAGISQASARRRLVEAGERSGTATAEVAEAVLEALHGD